MDNLQLRAMRPDDWGEVAELIYLSTNYWYQASGRSARFRGDPAATDVFCRIYEDLDPEGCLVVARDKGPIVGSCFVHPRSTHISIGIVNVHPSYFGRSVAAKMIKAVADLADAEGKPLRLVSSAMNLDSFSLYTRAGFVPRMLFQDMQIPEKAAAHLPEVTDTRVRRATTDDLPAIVALEREISGIERENDYRYFIENRSGTWHFAVVDNGAGGVDGFLVSIADAATRMLGPGVMRTDEDAEKLILAQLALHRGHTPVFLVPADHPALIARMYALGARNCELHLMQVRGDWQTPTGVIMPTFMPETG